MGGRGHEFGCKHESHRTATIIFAVDGRSVKVILQSLLFSGSCADIWLCTKRVWTDVFPSHLESDLLSGPRLFAGRAQLAGEET